MCRAMKDKGMKGSSYYALVYSKEDKERTYRPVILSLGTEVLEMAMKVNLDRALRCAALTLRTLWLRIYKYLYRYTVHYVFCNAGKR